MFLNSTPTLLGTASAGAKGKLSTRVAIPSTMAVGKHTLQIVGTSAKGGSLELAVGLKVDSAAAARGAHPKVVAPSRRVAAGDAFRVRVTGVQSKCLVRFTTHGSAKSVRAGSGGRATVNLRAPKIAGHWKVAAHVRGSGCGRVTTSSVVRVIPAA